MNTRHTLSLIIVMMIVATTSWSQCDRKQMVDDYEQYFLGTQISTAELDWTGDDQSCEPGHVSNMAMQAMVERINYYRRLAKVGTEISLDTSLTDMCQKAALIMHSNNELDHNPPMGWSCWTEDGKKAASKSNLALGAHSTGAISLYMRDPGTNNWAVGHRRWILFSRANQFGLGSTSRSHALYVIHNKQPASEDLTYIAYPNAGYFPAPLIADRWSFSLPKAKFGESAVTMEDEYGMPIELEVQPIRNGYGDNTIVWEPAAGSISRFEEFDQRFTVHVSHVVVGNDTLDFTYEVVLAPVQHPPACREESQAWDDDQCACVDLQTTSTREVSDVTLKVFPNPASDMIRITTESGMFSMVEIYNIAGSHMLQRNVIETDQIDLAISSLPEGVYLARVYGRGVFKTVYFVVQR